MSNKMKIMMQFIEDTKNVGFKNVRISHICRVIGVERKLFYYYFEDKYQLLLKIYQLDLLKYFDLISTNKNNWKFKATELLIAYKKYGLFYKQTVNEDEDLWAELFESHMTKLFQKLFEDLSVINEDEILFYAEFYANGWVGLIRKWIINGFSVKPNVLIERFEHLIGFTKNYIDNW